MSETGRAARQIASGEDGVSSALRGLRVDVVGSSRELFGSDRSAVRLSSLLQDSGAEVRLVVPAHRPELGLTTHARRLGVETVEAAFAVATSRGIENVRSLWNPTWPGGAPDVAIANTTAVLLPRLRSRTILVVREWLDPRRASHRALGTIQGRRAEVVVGISRGVNSQWSATAWRGRKPKLIWNWLEDEWLVPAPVPANRVRDILFLGRFSSWKGQDVLGDAYDEAFRDIAPDELPRLTFLGAEPKGSPFAGLAEALRVRSRSRPWDVLPIESTPRLALESSKLLVVPSLKPEPFGNVLLEGIAAGCRVVTFPGGGPDDLAPMFGGAIKVVERSRASLAAELRSWWTSGGAGQSATALEASQEVLSARFSAQRARREWVDAVRDAIR